MKTPYIFKIIKSAFCNHTYGDGKMCPFIDEYDNHIALYTCTKCGKNKRVTLYKK